MFDVSVWWPSAIAFPHVRSIIIMAGWFQCFPVACYMELALIVQENCIYDYYRGKLCKYRRKRSHRLKLIASNRRSMFWGQNQSLPQPFRQERHSFLSLGMRLFISKILCLKFGMWSPATGLETHCKEAFQIKIELKNLCLSVKLLSLCNLKDDFWGGKNKRMK